MLETIRLFAAERLAEAGTDEIAALSALHCTHYLAVAEEASPYLHSADQGRWRARRDVDQANLRRATGHAAAQADGTAQVLRFGIALWRYWAVRYAGAEAASLLVPALRRPEAALDPWLFAEALVSAARAIVSADLAIGVQLAGQAAELAEALGDNRLLILARGTLCLAYFASGKIEIARRLGQESVEQARKLGDDLLLGMSLRSYLLSLGPAEARRLYAEAIACTERCGDLGTNGALHNNAGIAAMEIGDLPGARAHFEAAIQGAEATGFASPTALGNLALVLRGEHDLDSARSAFDKALRISRRTGDKRTVAFIIHGLACLATDLSDWHRAASCMALRSRCSRRPDTSGKPPTPGIARRASTGGSSPEYGTVPPCVRPRRGAELRRGHRPRVRANNGCLSSLRRHDAPFASGAADPRVRLGQRTLGPLAR